MLLKIALLFLKKDFKKMVYFEPNMRDALQAGDFLNTHWIFRYELFFTTAKYYWLNYYLL